MAPEGLPEPTSRFGGKLFFWSVFTAETLETGFEKCYDMSNIWGAFALLLKCVKRRGLIG